MKLRIRPRMLIGFSAMSGLLIIVSILAILYTNRMQRNSTRILAENVTSLKSAEELEIALLDMKGLMGYYLLDGNNQWLDIFDEKKITFYTWLDSAQKRTHVEKEVTILKKIDETFQEYLKYKEEVERLFQSHQPDLAEKILIDNMRDSFNDIYNQCEELLLLNEILMNQTSLSISKDNSSINQIMVGIGIIGVIAGLALGLVLARSILHPITELVLKIKSATGEAVVEKVDVAEVSEIENLNHFVMDLVEKIKQTNQDLEQSQKMLMRSEHLASLGRMSAGLAHEIRNPLTAIKMLIFSLQKEMGNESEKKQDFQVIVEEIMRIEKLLQAFLDFARPPIPNFTSIQMNNLIRSTMTLLDPQLRNHHIRLSQKLDRDDTTIWGDEEQLKMVLINIILNAIQSMEKGGRLTIKTANIRLPNRAETVFRISIEDTGHGIPDEIKDSIYNPFVTTKESGMGLGLSITNQIIQNHHGWIVAKNNPKGGAIFTIFLPQTKVEMA
ncbi:MCP four helix bundle domain-containing protein [bacterium]|nr:MCP four helix bundle domain-containing protein [bacterium]RQV96342.1 MAG: hypothetical protein EH221_05065 [bacterium]